MSTKKPSSDINVNRLATLKKLGILKDIKAPTKNNPLSNSQKSKIRESYKKMSVVINSPSENFKKFDLKKYQKTDIQNLKNTGYVVFGDKVWLPTQGYDSVSIKREYVKTDNGLERVFNIVRRTKDGRKKEEEIVGTPLEKMQWRDRLRKEYDLKKLKEGDYFGIKVFDNGTFERRLFTDFNDMEYYVSNDIKIKDENDTDLIRDNLHVVKISVKDFKDLAANERTQKNKNRTAYVRQKNKKSMGGKIKKNGLPNKK